MNQPIADGRELGRVAPNHVLSVTFEFADLVHEPPGSSRDCLEQTVRPSSRW